MNHKTDKGAEDLYTPALGYRWLTPFYDSALALLTREGTWRNRLIEEIDPKEDDRILDVGCGTGTPCGPDENRRACGLDHWVRS